MKITLLTALFVCSLCATAAAQQRNPDVYRYEEAGQRDEMIGMRVIPGAEIIRKKSLGHLCMLFIRNAEKLAVEEASRTFGTINKSDIKFAVKTAGYDYSLPVGSGEVLCPDVKQGAPVEFTDRMLGEGKYDTKILTIL